ncbi:MAG: hypothetical protein ACOYXM_09205 [Actinomycetota bacterium]
MLLLSFLLLLTIGVEQTFYLDEWDFISARTAWDLPDLLRPHNEHWSTLPILLYRAWYRVFGLDSYLPYRAIAVAAHLATAVMMRLVLRRIGLGPWLSSAVVLPWVLFGSGWENIVWGFQVAWTGAIALSLTQLLLADHDGPRGRRDALGLLAGLAAIMSAGIAVPMVATVGMSLLMLRGWRVAALHVVPLAAVYALWSSRHGDTSLLEPGPDTDKVSFIWASMSSSVSSFSWWRGLGVVLSIGVALAIASLVVQRSTVTRAQVAIPASFAVGAIGYLYVVASGRAAFGADTARASRYQHVVVLMLLPLLGLAALVATRWIRRIPSATRRVATASLVLLLWAGIPGNLARLSDRDPDERVLHSQLERVEAMGALVAGRTDLPPGGQPFSAAPLLTIGWLQEAVAEGVLEGELPGDQRVLASLKRDLELLVVDEDADPSTCAPLRSPVTLDLDPGDTVSFRGATVMVEIDGPNGVSGRRVDLTEGHTLIATERIAVVFTPVFAGIQLCGKVP